MFTETDTQVTEALGLSPLGEAVCKQLKRIGHKGAHSIEHGNTLKSFDAARTAGVDMIEFDVIRQRRSGRLLIAHGQRAGRKTELTLEEGLAHLASSQFDGIELDVDMKFPGYERELVEALQAYGLVERSIVSSQLPWSLARVRAICPEVKLAWSLPGLRRLSGRTVFSMLERRMTRRAVEAIKSGKCNSIMAHWRLATPEFVKAIEEAGGEVYCWTVDEATRISQLAAMGVAGIVSNDPRLFGTLAA